MFLDEINDINNEVQTKTNIKYQHNNYFIDIDILIHLRKHGDEETFVLLLDTKITVNKNNYLDFNFFNKKSTENLFEENLKEYVIILFYRDIVYSIKDNIVDKINNIIDKWKIYSTKSILQRKILNRKEIRKLY